MAARGSGLVWSVPPQGLVCLIIILGVAGEPASILRENHLYTLFLKEKSGFIKHLDKEVSCC